MLKNEMKEDIQQRLQACQVGVFGVGEAGLNVLAQVRERLPDQISLLALDTDLDLLESSHLRPLSRLPFGQGTPVNRGRIDGRYGALCARDSRRRWGLKLRGLRKLVLVGGLGGETASGALPVIASEARRRGIATVAIIGLPFDFEGKDRQETAKKAIDELESACNGVIRITGADLEETVLETGTYAIFKKCDDEMAQMIETVCDLFLEEDQAEREDELSEELFEKASIAVSTASAAGSLAPRNAFFKAISRSSSWKIPLEQSETLCLTVRSGPQRENALEQVEALLLTLVHNTNLRSRRIACENGDNVRVTLLGINQPLAKLQEIQRVEKNVAIFPTWTVGGPFVAGMEEKN